MRKARKPSKEEIKRKADRAEARAKGEEPKATATAIDPAEVAMELHAAPKVGRPTKYEPAFCQVVLDLGAIGKSKAQIAKALCISRQTLDTWCATHPEFLDSVKHAKDLALAFWEEQGMSGIWAGKAFNSAAYIFQMKNRFPAEYRDAVAHELTGKDGGPIETKSETADLELARKVAFMLGKAVGKAGADKKAAHAAAR